MDEKIKWAVILIAGVWIWFTLVLLMLAGDARVQETLTHYINQWAHTLGG